MFTKGDPPPISGQILSCHPDNGASYIRIPKGLWTSSSDHGDVRFFTNKNGEMSYTEMALTAESYNDARLIFTSLLYRRLDRLSFRYNVPISIGLLAIRDSAFNLDSLIFISPYVISDLVPSPMPATRESEVAFALYREAQNSRSSAYKLLNYYKIIEMIQDTANPRIRGYATDQGIHIHQNSDRVPPGDYSAEVKPYIGKKIKDFRKDYLREECRNAIAHSELNSSVSRKKIPPLDLGSPIETHKLDVLVLPAELCARQVLDNHLDYWQRIQDKIRERGSPKV